MGMGIGLGLGPPSHTPHPPPPPMPCTLKQEAQGNKWGKALCEALPVLCHGRDGKGWKQHL